MSLFLPDYFLKQESFLQYCLQTDQEAVLYWERYVQSHPEQEAVIMEAREIFLEGRNMIIAEQYKPAAIEAMRRYLQENDKVKQPGKNNTSTVVYMRRWAAAAAVIIVVAFSWWLIGLSKSSVSIAAIVGAKKAQVYYYSAAGIDRKAFTLSDGSYVLLDRDATLRIDSAFDVAERKVYLSGTAWFHVAGHKEHAFRVITGEYVTTALGTAFRIQQDKNSKVVKIELEEGKVSVEKEKGNVDELITMLSPSESIVLGEAQQKEVHKAKFSLPQLKAWKAQEIIFDNAPLADVVQQLQQVYDLQISIEDSSLLKETFTGRFHQDAFTNVLDMICFSFNKQYKLVDGNKVLIY